MMHRPRVAGFLCGCLVLLASASLTAQTLEGAFIFGSRALTCETPNQAGTNYDVVLHGATPDTVAYDVGVGYGYEVLYDINGIDAPFPVHTARAGWEIFGPFDESANGRNAFPGSTCPEEIYDSFIGAKNFLLACDEFVVGNREDPCSTVQDPDGIIFRIDVPNGFYRFVAAVGDSENPHAHRILAENGGEGPPQDIGDHVVLVHNFDQSQQTTGQVDANLGEGVFARVGFDDKGLPPGNGDAEDPQFVNMDEEGRETPCSPNSPVLEVTEGYIRLHQLQANSNTGPGAQGGQDRNGGDMVLLELWRFDTEPNVEPSNFVTVAPAFDPEPHNPGDTVTLTLGLSGVTSQSTVEVTVPAGWTNISAPDGAVNGQVVTFDVANDQDVSLTATAPPFCGGVNFDIVATPTTGCVNSLTAVATCDPGECGLQPSGGVSNAILIGPVDLGYLSDPEDPNCDDNGLFPTTDYLVDEDGLNGETDLLVGIGNEILPDFGGLAGGVGVGLAGNFNINPNAGAGILETFLGTSDANGLFNFEDALNMGPTNYYVGYALVYVNNNTGDCLDCIIELGTDDSGKLLVNGQQRFTFAGCRGTPGYGAGDMVNVTLVPGTNIVLAAIVERGGGAGVRLIFRDTAGNPLTDGSISTTCEPPASYPDELPPGVVRSFDRTTYRPGDELTVTLSATSISGNVTVTDNVPAELMITSAPDGTINGQEVSFTISNDQDLTYTIMAPVDDGCPDTPGTFDGTATGGLCDVTIGGDSQLNCDAVCPVPPDAAPAELIEAFHFGSRDLACPTFNDPAVEYTSVVQIGGDPLSIAYPDEEIQLALGVAYPDPDRHYGFEIHYQDSQLLWVDDPNLSQRPGNRPDRGGWEIYGSTDDSVNGRNHFPDDCPEEIYDSFIGCKDWAAGQDSCSALTHGDANTPCSPQIPADGFVFRVDVPNGNYRFVAALGDVDNVHAHRLLAEDGGTGPAGGGKDGADALGDHVVLVHNFDQAQQSIGEVTPAEPGEGVFARVGFEGKIPPPGDGIAPSPQFINFDENGMETQDCPESPTLTVTQGYIRIHALQGNSNDGTSARDPNGGDLVILEIWRVDDGPVGERFVRGDSDQNQNINLTDGVHILRFLFVAGAATPGCLDASDADDMNPNNPNLTDGVFVFLYLFAQGAVPPPPSPSMAAGFTSADCGPDPTPEDGISCLSPPDYCN